MLISHSTASAAVTYWDPLVTGKAGGGAGTWDTTAPAWSTATTGGTNGAWVNGNDATFSGTAGNVTLGAPITAGRLTFTALAYTLTTAANASLTLTNGITANISTARAINTIAGAGGLVMNGAQTIDLTNGLNISTVLSGTGTLTKSGTGAVGLSATNTYSGKFVVTGGLLGISSDGALGVVPSSFQADDITLNGGGLLAGGVLSGPGNFNDPGSFSLSANRGITLGASGGIIRVGYGGTGGTMTVNGVITGSGALSKTDGGTLVLAADNTYTGTTTLAGTLTVGTGGSSGTLGSGKIIFATGTTNILNFNRSTDLVLAQDIDTGGRANIGVTTNKTVTINGAMTGAGELWKQGIGTLVVNANPGSARTGNTVIVDGTLQVADLTRTATSALGTGTILFGASTLGAGVGLSYTGPSVATDAFQSFSTVDTFIEVTNPSTTLSITNGFKANGVTAPAPANLLTKRGAGTLSLDGDQDNVRMQIQVDAGTLLLGKTVAAAHAIGSGLTLNNGTVRITAGGGDQIYDPSSVQVNGGVFDLNGYSEAFNGLSSTAANGVITNTAAGTTSTLTLGTSNASTVYTGKIQDGAGMLAFVKKGTGSQTFTGPTVFRGGASVTNGRLIVTGSLTGGTTDVSGAVTSGTFTGGLLGGTGTVGAVTTSGGILSPGASATGAALGQLKIGSLDMSSNGTFEVAISTASLASSLAEIQGDLSLGFSAAVLKLTEVGTATADPVGTTFTIMTYAGTWDGGTFLYGGGSLEEGTKFAYGPNTYVIDYDAASSTPGVKNIVLTVVVPEPSALTGLFIGGLAVLGLRRRKASAHGH